MFVITTIIVLSLICNCQSVTISATGMLLSTPIIRNFLIAKGFGYKVASHTSMLHDLSGYQYFSAHGYDKPHGSSTFSQSVIEVNQDNFIPKKRVKREHPSHEERKELEKLFGVLRDMERSTCATRLFCDIGHSPSSFGHIGKQVQQYLKSAPAVPWNSVSAPYIEAFNFGANGDSTTCTQLYGSCSYNIRRIIPVITASLSQ